MDVAEHKQILVVDDEQIDCQMLTIFLGNEYKLSFANTYEAACDLLLKQAYDLIITDLHMGYQKDGSEVLAFARSSKLNHKIPVIAYSASRAEQHPKGLEFDGYLTKPVLKDEFRKYVRSILKEIPNVQTKP